MTVAVWPADLPQRLSQDGFGAGLRDGRRGHPTDSGHLIMNRRFSSTWKPLTGAIEVEPGQVATLERFWDEDLVGGVMPFWFPDQVTDGLAIADGNGEPITDQDEVPITIEAWNLVQFAYGSSPQASSWGAMYRVSLSLVILP